MVKDKSIDIERIIIGELLKLGHEERIDAIIELEKIKFRNETYASLLRTIAAMTLENKDVDIVTVYQTNQEVPADEISRIDSEVYSTAYLKSHISELKKREYREKLLEQIHKQEKLIKTDSSLEELEENKNKLIVELSSLTIEDKSHFINIAEYKKLIEIQMNSNRAIEGYSWGISDLDEWTSGIVVPRVIVIGGLKKSGKTRFLIHTICQLHDKQVPVAFLSLEMPAYEITKLLHASFTGINDMRFRSISVMKHEELQAFKNVEIDESILGIECKSGLGLEEILPRIRRYAKMGFKVIALDYLQRISHDRNRQAQELENISIRLADVARNYNIALILLSQLNAMGEREVPNMGHLKGCVEENTLIDGIPIKEYYYNNLRREISSFDTKLKIYKKMWPSRIINSGIKECYEIVTKSGKKIIISGTTKLYTNKDKWEDVADIKVGTKIIVATD